MRIKPLLLAGAASLLATGCVAKVDTAKQAAAATEPLLVAATQPLSEAVLDEDVETWVRPPVGWTLDPVKRSDSHTHKTWLSPTRETAYGIIRIKLPFPMNEELALWGFMREMKRTEGESTLLAKEYDQKIKALRFVAEGGKYKVRTNMTVRGRNAWCVYAGTLKGHEPIDTELAAAVAAREATKVGR